MDEYPPDPDETMASVYEFVAVVIATLIWIGIILLLTGGFYVVSG